MDMRFPPMPSIAPTPVLAAHPRCVRSSPPALSGPPAQPQTVQACAAGVAVSSANRSDQAPAWTRTTAWAGGE